MYKLAQNSNRNCFKKKKEKASRSQPTQWPTAAHAGMTTRDQLVQPRPKAGPVRELALLPKDPQIKRLFHGALSHYRTRGAPFI
jgi:hypothetical protein